MSAKARLTQSIHGPARGRRIVVSVASAATTSSEHIPRENASRYVKPSSALRVAATQVRIAAITGAPHGAATRPETRPMISTPIAFPPVPADVARARSQAGTGTGIRSAIIAAAASITLAIANWSHGLVLTEPNSVPVR